MQEVASKMHKSAKEKGRASKTLPRGLKLTLFYRESDVVLQISRDGEVVPSDAEVKICQKAFFGDAEIINREGKLNAIYIAVEAVVHNTAVGVPLRKMLTPQEKAVSATNGRSGCSEMALQESKLDELLAQLKPHRRHAIEHAKERKTPIEILLHTAKLFLSDNLDDWTVATDTLHSFTSPFGFNRLQNIDGGKENGKQRVRT